MRIRKSVRIRNRIIKIFIIIIITVIAVKIIKSRNKDTTDKEPDVIFDNNIEIEDETKVTCLIDQNNQKMAKINVKGLTKVGNSESVVYAIKNTSSDQAVKFTTSIEYTNYEYFKVSFDPAVVTQIEASSQRAMTIYIELIKPLPNENMDTDITVQIEKYIEKYEGK